jgi:hypoxanthine-guanine phosphoribosyltransferase
MRAPVPEINIASRARVPTRWRKEVERILITDDQIAQRIRSMSRGIERDFTGREMVVVSLLNGTVMFLADLIRNLSLPLRLDFIGVSSYGAGTESGDLVFTKELRLGVRYGLDFAERYRNLPFVGVLHPHVYKKACQRVIPAKPKRAGGRRTV